MVFENETLKIVLDCRGSTASVREAILEGVQDIFSRN
jgi:hypothetical protein